MTIPLSAQLVIVGDLGGFSPFFWLSLYPLENVYADLPFCALQLIFLTLSYI